MGTLSYQNSRVVAKSEELEREEKSVREGEGVCKFWSKKVRLTRDTIYERVLSRTGQCDAESRP